MSKVVADEPCPSCRERGGDSSGNHLMIFEDGGKYCNRCKYRESPDGNDKDVDMDVELGEPIEYRGLLPRYLSMYGVGASFSESNGDLEMLAYPTSRGGQEVGHKLRQVASKTFSIQGGGKDLDLFGMGVEGGKRLCIITEGENDAIAAKQMIGDGNNWYDNEPRDYTVVSVPHGSGSKISKYSHEWLMNFETIIIATDMDDPGEELCQAINDMFPAHTCKRAIMPLSLIHI